MRTETYKGTSKMNKYYSVNIIHIFCEFKLYLHNGLVVFIAFYFFSNLLCAQTVWTTEDSGKLPKLAY